MLEHELVVGKSLAAAQHRAFQLLLGGHSVALISFDCSPDDESMKSAVVARSTTGPIAPMSRGGLVEMNERKNRLLHTRF
jgi:hypothetical protein